MPTPFVVLFPILLAMVAVWFATIIWVFRRLRTKHPEKYEQLGSPTLTWNYSPQKQLLFAKFVCSSTRELRDTALARAIIFMRVWFVVYLLLFLTLAVTVTATVKLE